LRIKVIRTDANKRIKDGRTEKAVGKKKEVFKKDEGIKK
jgi:hypothetical protein